jgi:hypothetical protein
LNESIYLETPFAINKRQAVEVDAAALSFQKPLYSGRFNVWRLAGTLFK